MQKKVLNLCAGIGGNRKFWDNCEVTAVENEPKIAGIYKELFQDDEVIIGDAYEYLKNNFEKFDIVWISPPCQKHSRMMKATRHKVADYPDFKLYEVIVFLQHFFKGKWVVENVVPYYKPLIEPTVKIGRHLFWSNCNISNDFHLKSPKGFITSGTVAESERLKEWLGLSYQGNVYYKDNHCPGQVLRNAVHPLLGLHIYNEILKSFNQ